MSQKVPFTPAQTMQGRFHDLIAKHADGNRVALGRQNAGALDQAERHAHNTHHLKKLYRESEDGACLLPNEYGYYVRPAFLELTGNSRKLLGEMHKRQATYLEQDNIYRKTTPFDAPVTECAHGIGCAQMIMVQKKSLEVTECMLRFDLAEYELPRYVFPSLAMQLLACTMKNHDAAEDAQKWASKLPDNHEDKPYFLSITPEYIAKVALENAQIPHAELLLPTLTRYLKAFTDEKKYQGGNKAERIAAQKIAPRMENDRLRRLGVIGDDPWASDPISNGKVIDKLHSNMFDALVMMTGHKSLHNDVDALLDHHAPRIDLLSSLRTHDAPKELYCELVELQCHYLRNPLGIPLPADVAAKKVIAPVLTHVANTLCGWGQKTALPAYPKAKVFDLTAMTAVRQTGKPALSPNRTAPSLITPGAVGLPAGTVAPLAATL